MRTVALVVGMTLSAGCGVGMDVEVAQQVDALDFSCPHYIEISCAPVPGTKGCCVPFGPLTTASCCPENTVCCPGTITELLHCCDSAHTCNVFRNVPPNGNIPGEFEAQCLPAICGGQSFNGLQQCCGASGAPVAKAPIANLAQCPDRISKPGYVPVPNGCGTQQLRLPDHFGNASFLATCNAHDICYVTCPNVKDACDLALLKGVETTCDQAYAGLMSILKRTSCNQIAGNAAFVAVTSPAGLLAYDLAQKKGCQCCL